MLYFGDGQKYGVAVGYGANQRFTLVRDQAR